MSRLVARISTIEIIQLYKDKRADLQSDGQQGEIYKSSIYNVSDLEILEILNIADQI